MPFDQISYAEIKADKKYTEDEDFRRSFEWLEKRIGFYPIFMACGNEQAEGLTGYANQWASVIGWDRNGNIRRSKGEFPNFAMLVFRTEDVQEAVFTDYDYWCGCLNSDEPEPYIVRRLFKRSWSRNDWFRFASRDPCGVQVLVPKLDTRKACEIWVRNQASRKKLLDMGFTNVIVKRLPIYKNRPGYRR
jgi:hypothetical protein